MKLHLVTHTHWDREWYRTFQEFRIYLVYLMDKLLDWLDSHDDYHSFLLDGQTAIIEDYLQVRPDQSERLKKHIQSGRIAIGPMYIQPDEYIPSGEALVRNFLIGHLMCEDYDRNLKIGYFPDSFGQASQIPQILKGFGIDRAVFWRGLCDEDLQKTEFNWAAKDGSSVRSIWMPYSYGNAYAMPANVDEAVAFIKKAMGDMEPLATTDHVLFMRGWDHSSFSPEITELIEAVNRELEGTGIELVHSDLDSLFDEIEKEVDFKTLPTLSGEFRNAKTMRIHPGIDATRMDIKQLNRRSQTLLEKYVEPLNAITWLYGEDYSNDVINHAWKYIIQSQAHDSICCCCTDEALQAATRRFEDAMEMGDAMLRNQSASFAAQVQTDAQPGIPLVVINTQPMKRNEVVEGEVVLPFSDFVLQDASGKQVPAQVLSVEEVNLGIDPSVQAMAVSDKEEGEKDLLQEVGRRPDDPNIYYNQNAYVPLTPRAEGVKGYRVRFSFSSGEMKGISSQVFYLQKGNPASQDSSIKTTAMSIENDLVRLEFAQDGSFTLTHKKNNKVFTDQHVFEDNGDAGDSYNYSPPREDKIYSSKDCKATITPLHSGSLQATYRVEIPMQIPVGLTEDHQTRANELTTLNITSDITLTHDSPLVSIKTSLENNAHDHRLRVLFTSGFNVEQSFAEEQYGVIARQTSLPQREYWEKEGWTEDPQALYPQQNFVELNDGTIDHAVLNRDLTEYEVLDRETSTLAITLFRSVGAMGRPNLVIRPGRASGLEVPTPDSLLLKPMEFNYALYAHEGGFGSTSEQACLFNAPMTVVQNSPHAGDLEAGESLLMLSPGTLIPTCLKKAEREDALILRFYNGGSRLVSDGTLNLSNKFSHAVLVNLNEEDLKLAHLAAKDGKVQLPDLKPGEICTLKLVRKE